MLGAFAPWRKTLRTLGAASVALGLAASGAMANPVLLVEADSGKVLEQQDAGKPWYPASVTKLMTTYVALSAARQGRLAMDTPLTVTARAASQQPSKMGFRPGTKVTLDNALKMLMVKSANDMAVTIAEGVGGSVPGFVDEMNATAQRLGMTGTHFENPNGLPAAGQVTTARDLAILARAIIYHFPEQESLFRIPAIRLGNRVLRNYNRLIDRYPGADGMKTGFICASGFNLVASATRGHKRLIVVILGSGSAVSRTEEAALLLEKGFQPTWSFFDGGGSVEGIRNMGGEPTNMRDVVCNRKRPVVAAENEDEFGFGQGEVSSAAFAASVGAKVGLVGERPGAALLQPLAPSMDPVPVYVGAKGAPEDPETAFEREPEPKTAKTAKSPANAKAGAKTAAAKPAAKPATDGAEAATDKPTTDKKAKTAAKTAASQAKSTNASAAAKPAVKPKPAATASAAAAPAPKPKPAAKPQIPASESAAAKPGT